MGASGVVVVAAVPAGDRVDPVDAWTVVVGVSVALVEVAVADLDAVVLRRVERRVRDLAVDVAGLVEAVQRLEGCLSVLEDPEVLSLWVFSEHRELRPWHLAVVVVGQDLRCPGGSIESRTPNVRLGLSLLAGILLDGASLLAPDRSDDGDTGAVEKRLVPVADEAGVGLELVLWEVVSVEQAGEERVHRGSGAPGRCPPNLAPEDVLLRKPRL